VIGALLLTSLLAGAAPDPCAPVPALEPDRQASTAYGQIADEERAAGRKDSAAAAYRSALGHDPSNARARTGLAELCMAERKHAVFARGLELFRAGQCAAALDPLGAAHAQGNLAAALLEGICLFRAGQDDRATIAFRDAERDPASAAPARLFLGLLALRHGRPGEAAPLIDAAAADPLLSPVAQGLSRDVQRLGRVVVSVLAEGGWDSNAKLAPGSSVAPPGADDGFAGGAAVISAAPWGENGAYARAAGTWRDEFHQNDLDLLGAGGAAGFQLGTARQHLLVEGGYDTRWQAGKFYLSAPLLTGEGRVALGKGFGAGGWYSARWESYHAGQEDESGLRQSGQVDVTADASGRAELTLAWQGALDAARTTSLAFREHGPLLSVAFPVGSRTRIVTGAAWTWREYDAQDPDLGTRRADRYADAAASAEVDLSARWTVYLSVAGRRAYSNLQDFRYARVVSTLGVSWTMGIR
jgi:hypothetical protein